MLEQQVLKRVKDSDFGMNSKSFPAIIEDIVKEKKISYIDATLETCERFDIDPRDVKRLLNKQIKEKIEFDALNNNQLKYKKRTLV
jgi:hypothetical protein|tara:strand:+ start:973 stop:1230 length:258 start_codon:yes stop_codon:yes gene_type:complete